MKTNVNENEQTSTEVDDTWYRETKTCEYCASCDECDMTIDGVWSNGKKLANGYEPKENELLKNHHMMCDNCGFEQWS